MDASCASRQVDLDAYQRGQGRSHVRLTVYPGAYHAYDFPHPSRYNELGKYLAFDPEATRDSER